MVSFVRDIPRELVGAMLVDGGTEWTVFRRLIVPKLTNDLQTTQPSGVGARRAVAGWGPWQVPSS